LEEKSKKETVPDDICYVFNFSDSDHPSLLLVSPGWGKALQSDMLVLIDHLKTTIPSIFETEDYEKLKSRLINKFKEQRDKHLEDLEKKIKKYSFTLLKLATGLSIVPLGKDGKALSQQQYNDLAPEQKEVFENSRPMVQDILNSSLMELRRLEREAQEQIQELDKEIASLTVGSIMSELKKKYEDFSQIQKYFKQVEEEILNNIPIIKNMNTSDSQQIQNPFEGDEGSDYFNRFRVNVLVDNSKTEGAPVIYETNPTYYNLIGRIEHKTHMGMLITDFTMIKPGALHKANGGYLILQAYDLLVNPFAWDTLTRALKNKRIRIEELGHQYAMVSTTSLEPEFLPMDVKVILIGNTDLYYMLNEYDDNFPKLFKVQADFDTEMPRNKENIIDYAAFIATICNNEDLLHLDKAAVAEVIEYSSRLAEDKDKLTTQFIKIVDLLREASYWADRKKHEYVQRDDILRAIMEKEHRSNRIEDRMTEYINNGTVMIDTRGEQVGQINGLSVISLGDYYFGRPSRITARAYPGKKGIINIEREVKMSGPIHDKGVLILSGYLSGKYGIDTPLSVSASICFEQSYSGIEGDSASSTELYALLSSIGNVPLKQNIAVTGSVNQNGEIQPIGGVNYKIEGFYEICKAKRLNGEQGVIIPHQNIRNLMLKDEVIQAVKDGKFHIWAVSTIDEGLSLLTGMKAGKRLKDGSYTKNSINDLIVKRLKEFAAKVKKEAEKDGSSPSKKRKRS
ncbi:AAA family ATPase, partial [bacterium]|nr:AAA family ATPase [bacterium]